MTLQGDLSTLDLADLLQNLEQHGRTGLLTIEGVRGTTRLFFERGKLALLDADGRPPLVDALVDAGAITDDDLLSLRKRRRLGKKPLGELLVAADRLARETLQEIAEARLLDEACELIATRAGAFTFAEGPAPEGLFDADERRLGLALPSGPLLMESARREDHWRLIRQRIPSDAAHYVAERDPTPLVDPAHAALAKELCERLDGSRSVAEAMARFPHRRFEAYQILAHLCEKHAVRLAGPDEMASQARSLLLASPERAGAIVTRGLHEHPQHAGLLEQRVRLARAAGDPAGATEALKMLVQLLLEADEPEAARKRLEEAKTLSPKDTALWERSFALALEDGRRADALADGRRLVALYREPGLHRKARTVLEQLVELAPGSWDLRRELAHSRADCDDLPAAVAGLEAVGGALLGQGEYLRAAAVYEEILRLDPRHAPAKEALAAIQSGALERRRERRERFARRTILALASLLLVTFLSFELAARRALLAADRAIVEQALLESGRHASAIHLLRQVAALYPATTTARLDVPARIAALERRLADAAAERTQTPWNAPPPGAHPFDLGNDLGTLQGAGLPAAPSPPGTDPGA